MPKKMIKTDPTTPNGSEAPPLHILSLHAENTLGLKLVEIKFDDGVTVVGGPNGSGKTSILRSLELALFGKAVFNGRAIKDGEEKATIAVELGGEAKELTVTRTIRAGKDGAEKWGLKVQSPDGATYSSGQALLNALTGGQMVDFLAFDRMKAREQVRVLKEILGLDTDEQDAKRLRLYDERAILNKQAGAARTLHGQMPHCPGVGTKERSVADVTEKIGVALANNRAVEDAHKEADRLFGRTRELEEDYKNAAELVEDQLNENDRQVAELKAHIANIEKASEGIRAAWAAERKERKGRAKEATAAAEAARLALDDMATINLDDLQAQARELDETNAKVRENVAYKQAGGRVAKIENDSRALTDEIDAIDKEVAGAIAAVEMPVSGMTFDGKTIYIAELPYANAPTSTRIRLCLALAMAKKPRLRTLWVDGGEALDAESLSLVREIAAANNYRMLVTRVVPRGTLDNTVSLSIDAGEVTPGD